VSVRLESGYVESRFILTRCFCFRGEIGLAAFRFIVRDPRLAKIPLILETPTFEETEVWKREMEILYQLQEVEGTDEEVEVILKEMTDSWRDELKEMRAKSGKGPKPKPAKKEKTPTTKKKGRGKKESDDDDSGGDE
jgi:AP endonuclease-1